MNELIILDSLVSVDLFILKSAMKNVNLSEFFVNGLQIERHAL